MKRIQLRLISDGTFGRGDGVPGIVDDEIDHDMETGLPFIKGRTIKGLIVEECSNLLFSLSRTDHSMCRQLEKSAQRLFGSAGSTKEEEGLLHFGEARVDDSVQEAIVAAMRAVNPIVTPLEILNSLTGVRRRSAVDEATEAPADETLRATRVLMRETILYARLVELGSLEELDWQLLATTVASLRRGGKNRNRGAGRMACALLKDANDVTRPWKDDLLQRLEVAGAS